MQITCNYTSSRSTTNSQNLPRLPVPKLKDTIEKYLLTVRPHLNDEEFAKTTSLVKDFVNGTGQKLQVSFNKINIIKQF